MPTWPAGLPQKPLINAYGETFANLTIASPVDDGPPKVRKFTTYAVDPYTFRFVITTAQRLTFETFYKTTVNGGADTFTWAHPITAASDTWRFNPTSTPKFVPVPNTDQLYMDIALLLL
jgi:hypothetical protein